MRILRVTINLAFLIFSFVIFSAGKLLSQEDTTKQVKAITIGTVSDTIRSDSTKVVEDAALDIAQNRGLFIVTHDGKMQLRILGSVRFLAVFDNKDLLNKNGYKTYEIPVGAASYEFPNIYSGLEQSRLGFEITRQTERGNEFVRLETDFAGPNGFRIRHAYGQYRRVLLGQTWSLFTHIESVPATVDFNGPTGSIAVRTPQIRFSFKELIWGSSLSVGMEYFKPDVNLPDSLKTKSFQLIPDLTCRIEKVTPWGAFRASGLLTVLSGRSISDDRVDFLTGWGASFSTIVNSWANGKWYINASTGQGIARFYGDLSGYGQDLVISPVTFIPYLPFTLGGYVTYEHSWNDRVFSSFTYGSMGYEKFSFSPGTTFRWSDSFRVNTFWTIAEGARTGFEAIYGVRHNVDGQEGYAVRWNLLFYYDF